MAFRFKENRQSRSSTTIPAAETRIYTATGSNDETFVRAYAIGGTPAFLAHPRGTIYKQDVKLTPRGYAIWDVEVPYAPNKKSAGNYSISFDTSGGTVHITNSLQTIQKYSSPTAPKPAQDMGGAIGVRGDEIDGVDIVIPALKISVSFTHPAGIITLAQIKNLARWTGRYNTAQFLTFAESEVLFLGCQGTEGTDIETQITYQFAMSENTTGQTVGDIANVDKKGWEHAWISYRDAAVNGVPIKKPQWVYVERVYQGVDLAAGLGFGG